jgi:Polyketide cyclase / dehydrase and lipid transport
MSGLAHHYETSALVQAPMDEVFTYVDDPTRLGSHMSKSSWMMGGSRMQIELDDDRGQRVGSRIRMRGRIFGLRLSLEEVVTEYNFPHRKVWETTGAPKLLVIGHYRMGFEIGSRDIGSLLRVYIDYSVPHGVLTRWLGYLLGPVYARWCTQQMAKDTVKHFALSEQSVSSASPQRRVR